MNKSGPWSADEKLYIEENCDIIPYIEIAEYIKRSPESVKMYIKKTLGRNPIANKYRKKPKHDFDIQSTLIWKQLRAQFTTEELQEFMFHWDRIVGQFKEDILATEEMQIVDYIRLEILIGRLLIQQQKSMEEISKMEKELAIEQGKKEKQDTDKINRLSEMINFYKASLTSITKEYQTLYAEKTKTLEKMKGTRDARVKHFESSKESFLVWVKQIVTDEKMRKEVGLYMEKLRLAMKQEEERLSKPHKYIDGIVDLPLLTTETISKLDE